MRRCRSESTRRPADRQARPATDRPPEDSVRSVEFTPGPLESPDSTRIAAGTVAAVSPCINPRSHAMNTIDNETLDNVTLDNVTGGAAAVRTSSTSNDAITQSLTSLQTTISQLTNNNNNNQNNYLLPMMMALVMNRRQPTIVSGGATVVG
jgi:hypothetical protein